MFQMFQLYRSILFLFVSKPLSAVMRPVLRRLLDKESPASTSSNGKLNLGSFFFFVWKGKISPLWITPGSSVNEMIVSRGGPGIGGL